MCSESHSQETLSIFFTLTSSESGDTQLPSSPLAIKQLINRSLPGMFSNQELDASLRHPPNYRGIILALRVTPLRANFLDVRRKRESLPFPFPTGTQLESLWRTPFYKSSFCLHFWPLYILDEDKVFKSYEQVFRQLFWYFYRVVCLTNHIGIWYLNTLGSRKLPFYHPVPSLTMLWMVK